MIYLANDKYNDALTSGYTVGQSTLYISTPPDNVPTIIVAAKGTDNETVFAVTGKTVNSLTGVTRLRGANVDLDAQTPITCLNNQEFVNQYANAVSSAQSLSDIIFAVDGGSTDDYAISVDPAPSAYVEGNLFLFKANTANTGACTLNVNGLGAKALKINKDQDPPSGYIKAGSIVVVVYNGTNFEIVSVATSPGVTNAEITAIDGPTVTFDLNATNKHKVVLGGNRILALSGGYLDQYFTIKLVQDATGGRTPTWFSGITWAGGSAPSLTTTANKADRFGFIVTSVDASGVPNAFEGHVIGQDI